MQYLEKHNAFRHSVINQLQTQTAGKIFARDTQYYAWTFDRMNLPEFKAELIYPGENRVSIFAPILFPNREKKMDVFLQCKHFALVRYSVAF